MESMLGILGIIVTVLVGFIGIFFATKKIAFKSILNFKKIKNSSVDVRDIHIGNKTTGFKEKK